MRNSFKNTPILSENHTLTKNHNRSLKSLDHSNRLKLIFQSSEKIIPSKSTRNAIKLPQKNLGSPKYFKKDMPSVQNRRQLLENKENMKLPFITKSNIAIKEEKRKKKPLIKHNKSSGKKMATQPMDCHFLTIGEEGERAIEIKESLLQILDLGNRKQISIESEIEKLCQLTKKGLSLRKHLRIIQQDMLSLNLKKKLSKISLKNSFSFLQ